MAGRRTAGHMPITSAVTQVDDVSSDAGRGRRTIGRKSDGRSTDGRTTVRRTNEGCNDGATIRCVARVATAVAAALQAAPHCCGIANCGNVASFVTLLRRVIAAQLL